MTNVLVTGCTGFIGSNLCTKLIERGYNVYGLIRHTSRHELKNLENVLDRIKFIEGDLTVYHSIRSAVQTSNARIIVHLGALTPVRLSFEDPFPYLNINFVGTCNMVHSILEASPRTRLICASTAEVYGWQNEEPIKESAMLKPSSPYGVSKSAADEYVQMANVVYGLRSTILRCNNTYGRKGETGFLVEQVITSITKGGPVYVGAPEHVRDYMYVDDHVNAYVLAMENERAEGEAFNVSPGNPISNIDITRKIAKMMVYKGRIVQGSYPPGYPMRPAGIDTKYIVLDSSKIRNTIGWKPSVTLEQGLKIIVGSWIGKECYV